MKKKLNICIITDDHSVKSDQYLEEAITLYGHQLTVIDHRKHLIDIKDGNILIDSEKLDIAGIDAVISQPWGFNDEKTFTLQEMMELAGVKPLNRVESMRIASSKIRSQLMFETHGLPSPKTFIIHPSEEHKTRSETFLRFFEEIGGKCVIKAEYGAQGKQIRFASSLEEAIKHIMFFLQANHGVVIQELIKSLDDRGQDLRILVIGDRIAGGLLRTGKKGNLISNTSQGGSGEFIPVDKLSNKQCDISLSCSKVTSFRMLGIDLMGNDDAPQIIEINEAPQLDWFIERYNIPVHEWLIQEIEKLCAGQWVSR